MRTGLNLTIQDYFKQSGMHRPAADNGAGNTAGAGHFSKALAAAQSSTASESKGLTIRDYLARPVTVQRPPLVSTPVFKQSSLPLPPNLNEIQAPEPAEPLQPRAAKDRPAMGTASQKAPVEEKAQILASIDEAAKRYDLPKALIQAVVQAESDYQVRAVSSAGAQGLMQLMPATARELGVKDPFDINQNIDGGAKYLRRMLDQFNGDIKLALSAYNAGPGTVIKYDGRVPFAETRAYVDRVMRFRRGFSYIHPDEEDPWLMNT